MVIGMAGEPVAGRGRGGPEIVELGSVPGFVVFDLPGVPVSAGGTRLAPDVGVAEVALLARAMTYKFAVLGQRVGGAKAGVRGDPADRAGKDALMARFCAEVSPLVDAGRFLTGPDMGTAEEDFAPLRERRAAPAAMRAVVDGVPFEDVLTGYGVAAAAEAALRARWGRGWDGRSVAIEGFGKVGGGVAREVIRRVRVIAPAANVPYTAQGADVLRRRGIVALPDFVCNAGAVIGYRSAADATPGDVLAAVDATITRLILEALREDADPLAAACDLAGRFLRSWWGEPPDPPFAP
jgi:glutamate dehydrogenase/leucine dehydrogenase